MWGAQGRSCAFEMFIDWELDRLVKKIRLVKEAVIR